MSKALKHLQDITEYDPDYQDNAYGPGDRPDAPRLTREYTRKKMTQHRAMMKKHPEGSKEHEFHKKLYLGYKNYKHEDESAPGMKTEADQEVVVTLNYSIYDLLGGDEKAGEFMDALQNEVSDKDAFGNGSYASYFSAYTGTKKDKTFFDSSASSFHFFGPHAQELADWVVAKLKPVKNAKIWVNDKVVKDMGSATDIEHE